MGENNDPLPPSPHPLALHFHPSFSSLLLSPVCGDFQVLCHLLSGHIQAGIVFLPVSKHRDIFTDGVLMPLPPFFSPHTHSLCSGNRDTMWVLSIWDPASMHGTESSCAGAPSCCHVKTSTHKLIANIQPSRMDAVPIARPCKQLSLRA